jgi:hypothetical protein
MNAIKGSFLIATLSLAFLGASCAPEILPPAEGTSLSIQATAPGSLATAARASRSLSRAPGNPVLIPLTNGTGATVGEVSLTSAKVVVKEFEFEMVDATGDGEFEFKGPYIVDLLSGTMDPQPPFIDLPPGVYDEIKFKIDAPEAGEKDEDGADLIASTDPAVDPNADMLGYSIRLEGSVTPTGGQASTFSFNYSGDEIEFALKGAAATGFTIEAGVANDIVIAFRLVRWFDSLDPAAFAADPQGYLDQNTETFRDSIKLSADYGKDEDHDGKLESNEDDDPDEAENVDD